MLTPRRMPRTERLSRLLTVIIAAEETAYEAGITADEPGEAVIEERLRVLGDRWCEVFDEYQISTHEAVRIDADPWPECAFCKEPAVVDARTNGGRWAYMCPIHHNQHGANLGLGVGQILLRSKGA